MLEIQKNLQNLCQLFLHFITHTKKLSTQSLKAYKTDLRDFFELKDLTLTQKNIIPNVKNKRERKKTYRQSFIFFVVWRWIKS